MMYHFVFLEILFYPLPGPYTKYYYGTTFGVGRRIAMEIKEAISSDRIKVI